MANLGEKEKKAINYNAPTLQDRLADKEGVEELRKGGREKGEIEPNRNI